MLFLRPSENPFYIVAKILQMDTNGVSTVQRLLISEAHVLTDGLAGAESRMIGIIGLHHKAARERHFPLHLLEKGLQVKIEVTWRGIAKQVPSFDIVCAAGQSQLKCIFHGPLFQFIVLHGTYGISWNIYTLLIYTSIPLSIQTVNHHMSKMWVLDSSRKLMPRRTSTKCESWTA